LPKDVRLTEIKNITELQNNFNLNEKSIIVDSIFGTGLNKPAEGLAAETIDHLNTNSNSIIAIDIPSGMFCDSQNSKNDVIINASATLTFQFPKLSFMFAENADHVGELAILDIGLHKDHINAVQTQNYFLTKKDISSILKKRSLSSHKGTYGHSLLIAGSFGKMGAAVLSAKAALRSGTGLLTVHVPKCGYDIIQSSVPEAMSSMDEEEKFWSGNIDLEKYNAIGIGPGIGTEKQTQNVLKLVIQNTHVPLVIDADALNIISENKTWLAFLPANSILTPHPKEFERLTEKVDSSKDRIELQREFSLKNRVYVILKGVHTSISCPDGTIFFNSTGNPGMAKGGSGDVLTGIITALMAQHYNSREACILGVYLHGLAGDIAAEHLSQESMLPSDLIEKLPLAFNWLRASD
jgi:NAD(P)H-hydrate epimerase